MRFTFINTLFFLIITNGLSQSFNSYTSDGCLLKYYIDTTNTPHTATLTEYITVDCDSICTIPNQVSYKEKIYTVKEIAYFCHDNCTELLQITIPDSIQIIDYRAFINISNLETVNFNAIHSIVTNYPEEITVDLFPNSVKYFNIGTQVKKIPFYLCHNLTNLDSITIPESVTEIGRGAFLGCSSLDVIFYNAINSTTWDNLQVFPENLSKIIIGNSVRNIPYFFFSYLNNLDTIILPESISHIDAFAFQNCNSIKKIILNDSIKAIRSNTFYGCKNLFELHLPKSIGYIGDNAFKNCINIERIYIKAISPPEIFNTSFDGVDKSIPIYVPKGCIEKYKNSNFWNYFTNFIEY